MPIGTKFDKKARSGLFYPCRCHMQRSGIEKPEFQRLSAIRAFFMPIIMVSVNREAARLAVGLIRFSQISEHTHRPRIEKRVRCF
jgi:hypothetical protein